MDSLEQDADSFEHGIETLAQRLEQGLRNTQRILIGLIVTVAGGSVIIALSAQVGGS